MLWAHRNFTGLHVWDNRGTPRRMLKKAVQRSVRRETQKVSEEAHSAVLRFTFHILPFTVFESDASTPHGKRSCLGAPGLGGRDQ